MKTVFLSLLFVISGVSAFAQLPISYQIFRSNGKPATIEDMNEAASKMEVILFGEMHDNAVSHALQNDLAKSLYAKKDTNFAIGAEMIELHQQEFLTKYLQTGDMKLFQDSAKMWSNFETDYRPLLEWSQQNHVNYFASNVTRKYASLIFKKGLHALDTISTEERKLMCPLPFPFDSALSQYEQLIAMGLEMHASGINFALAQAIKDATMAYQITEKLKEKSTILHLNGAFHSDFHQGIMWYIEHYRKGTKVFTITTVYQEDLKKLKKKNRKKADFIIVVEGSEEEQEG